MYIIYYDWFPVLRFFNIRSKFHISAQSCIIFTHNSFHSNFCFNDVSKVAQSLRKKKACVWCRRVFFLSSYQQFIQSNQVIVLLIFLINKQKTCPLFPYSYRNTSGSLGEREIEVSIRVRRASVSTLFRVLPNFHECFYNVWEHGGNFSISFIK